MDRFDRLIRDAAPEVPDAGPSRRTTLMLLHQRPSPRRSRRYDWSRPVAVTAAAVTLCLLTFGSPGDLGSDAFEYDLISENTTNGLSVFKSRIGAWEWGTGSAQQARELAEAQASRQYELAKLTGLEIDGDTDWTGFTWLDTPGKPTYTNGEFDLPSSRPTPRHFELLESGIARTIVSEARSRPADSVAIANVDGFEVLLSTWTFQIPKYGRVRYHVGIPLHEYGPTP